MLTKYLPQPKVEQNAETLLGQIQSTFYEDRSNTCGGNKTSSQTPYFCRVKCRSRDQQDFQIKSANANVDEIFKMVKKTCSFCISLKSHKVRTCGKIVFEDHVSYFG